MQRKDKENLALAIGTTIILLWLSSMAYIITLIVESYR